MTRPTLQHDPVAMEKQLRFFGRDACRSYEQKHPFNMEPGDPEVCLHCGQDYVRHRVLDAADVIRDLLAEAEFIEAIRVERTSSY